MRVYTGDAAAMTLNPPWVATSANRVLDRKYLQDAWKIDILSDEGFAKMKEIVTFIKTTPPVIIDPCMHLQFTFSAHPLIFPQDKSLLTAYHSRQSR
jgi:hypothetical protein